MRLVGFASLAHFRSLPPTQALALASTRARTGGYATRRRARRVALQASEDSGLQDFDQAAKLLRSGDKANMQKGLLLARKVGPENALRLLQIALEETGNDFIRATAAVGLGQISDAPPKVSQEALRTLLYLVESDADYGVRAAAAAGCGYLGDSGATQTLTRACYEDPEWQVTFSAVVALGNIGDPTALPVLGEAMESDNDLIVQAAIGALSDIGLEESVDALLRQMESDDVMTRQRLAVGLGLFAPLPRVLDALTKLCNDPIGLVADAASDSLIALGRPELATGNQAALSVTPENSPVAAVEEKTEDTESARSMLERSFSISTSGEEDPTEKIEEPPAQSEQLQTLCNDYKHGEMKEQLVALIKMRQESPESVEAFIISAGVLRDPSERIRCVALPLMKRQADHLVDVLENDKDHAVRSTAIDVLSEENHTTKKVLDAITVAFETDQHWLVRISASIAMGFLGKENAGVLKSLIKSLDDGAISGIEASNVGIIRRNVITSLGFLGAVEALPTLLPLSQSSDVSIRYRLAGALAGIDDASSVSCLRKLAEDVNDDVAKMASSSLERLEI